MDLVIDDLGSILEVASKHKIRKLKVADVEIEFFPEFPELQPIIMASGPITPQKIGEEYGMPTDDQLLFHSSGFPMTDEELKAQAPHG